MTAEGMIGTERVECVRAVCMFVRRTNTALYAYSYAVGKRVSAGAFT